MASTTAPSVPTPQSPGNSSPRWWSSACACPWGRGTYASLWMYRHQVLTTSIRTITWRPLHGKGDHRNSGGGEGSSRALLALGQYLSRSGGDHGDPGLRNASECSPGWVSLRLGRFLSLIH